MLETIWENLFEIIVENIISSLILVIVFLMFIPSFRKKMGEVLSCIIKVIFKNGEDSKTESDGTLINQDKKKREYVDEKLYFDPDLEPTLADREKNIWADIKAEDSEKYPEHRKNSVVKSLVKKLAITRMQAELATLFSAIYGIQIRLLRKIDERGNSIPYNEIHAYFLEIQKASPMSYDNVKMDDCLGYLLRCSLITRQGESYSITEFGIEFLTWMSKERIDENKPW